MVKTHKERLGQKEHDMKAHTRPAGLERNQILIAMGTQRAMKSAIKERM